jgi:GT2 family glycosyltransferase
VPESHFDGVAAPQGVRGAADPAAPRACTFVSGCCVLLRASVVRELGSFRSEYFAYVEDVELSVRYARAGWRLLYVPAAQVVHHAPWPEPPLAPWKIRLRDLNRRRLARAHYPAAERARFAVWFYPTRLLRFIAYALAGDGARAAAIWRGMTGTLAGPSRP